MPFGKSQAGIAGSSPVAAAGVRSARVDTTRAGIASRAWTSSISFHGYPPSSRTCWSHTRAASSPSCHSSSGSEPIRSALLDGEMVVQTADGRSDIAALQAAVSGYRRKAVPEPNLVFYAFDLIHLDGADLRGCRLEERRDALHVTDQVGIGQRAPSP